MPGACPKSPGVYAWARIQGVEEYGRNHDAYNEPLIYHSSYNNTHLSILIDGLTVPRLCRTPVMETQASRFRAHQH